MIVRWPTSPEYRHITQPFGNPAPLYTRLGYLGHEGLDLRAPIGTPVYAAHDGRVTVLWAPASYGRYVMVETDWILTLYGHLSRALRDGELVEAGTLIGYSGNTGGTSTGAHLHFGAKPQPVDLGNGYKGWIDPLPLLLEGERIMDEALKAALAEATAVRFEVEQIVRLRQEAAKHRDQAASEEMMAERCNNQANMREAALVSTKNGRAYRVEGALGGALPKDWEG